MADFNITVDTHPMANSLDNVNSNVRNVTASVVAMQAAVVLAEETASNHICKNVDKGFFVLMKSQFDQKIAAVTSQMLSTSQLMDSLKNDVDKIMVIMSDDYDRVKTRYMRHFDSLNKSLETRVHELDKYAYEISKRYKMSQFKTGSEVIKTICYNDDTQIANVKQTNAVVKSKSAKSIDVMTGNVIEQQIYSDSIRNILKDIDFESVQEEYVPVLFSESDSMMSTDSVVKNVFTTDEVSFSTNSYYLNSLKQNAGTITWKEVDDTEYEPVKSTFQDKVSTEISDGRVAKEMIRLFNETKWMKTEENK